MLTHFLLVSHCIMGRWRQEITFWHDWWTKTPSLFIYIYIYIIMSHVYFKFGELGTVLINFSVCTHFNIVNNYYNNNIILIIISFWKFHWFCCYSLQIPVATTVLKCFNSLMDLLMKVMTINHSWTEVKMQSMI